MCRGVQRGRYGPVKQAGGHFVHLDLYVDHRVVQLGHAGGLGRPLYEVEHGNVVGLLPSVVLAAHKEGVHAQILRPRGRVCHLEDGRILAVHLNVALARDDALRVAVHVRLDVLQAGPVHGHVVVLERGGHQDCALLPYIGYFNSCHIS